MADEFSGGLLSETLSNPLLNLGIGLLSASGPSLTPVNTGQALASGLQFANQAEQLAMRNRLVRSELSAEARKRAATEKLKGLLGSAGEEGAMLGLLADIAPEQLASGLLATERAEPDEVRMLRAAGIDPSSEVGRKFLLSSLAGEGLETRQTQLEIDALERKAREDNQMLGIERVTSESAIDSAAEALQILDRLEKSPIPPGSAGATAVASLADPESGLIAVPPGVVAQTIAAFTGQPFTEEDARQFTTDYNRLNKLSAKFVTDFSTLQKQQTGAGARVTNLGLDFLERQNLSPTIDVGANRLILQDILKRQLEVAKVRGYELGNASVAEDILNKKPPKPLPSKITSDVIRQDGGKNFRILFDGKNYFLRNPVTEEQRPLTEEEKKELGVMF